MVKLTVVVGGPRARLVELWSSLVSHLLTMVGYLNPRHLLVVWGHFRDCKRSSHWGPRDVIRVPVWGSGYHWGHCQLAPLTRMHLGGEKHAFKLTKQEKE